MFAELLAALEAKRDKITAAIEAIRALYGTPVATDRPTDRPFTVLSARGAAGAPAREGGALTPRWLRLRLRAWRLA